MSDAIPATWGLEESACLDVTDFDAYKKMELMLHDIKHLRDARVAN